ncbi:MULTISPECIES: hypothetical protein [unclassified Janthinobacterium]|uniref:hypothetical protein n=1 Tax=unclassified Janthinobacterium TaxID=2610881 RepID=UPI0027124027|nr:MULTISPECIES: hypothetical protein [unclassified Janthinobacterium]MDO8049189.1 hypothetical protein [Janthinobacterium sp. SUN211]MDO8067813.1 hypothetical protein [Janthinobacterium sp. SUN206]
MMIIGIAAHQKKPPPGPLSSPGCTAGMGRMAHCINPLIDTVLDITDVKKVIGEGWMDKLVSAVACNRPSARSPPIGTTALAHSTIEDGGDLK